MNPKFTQDSVVGGCMRVVGVRLGGLGVLSRLALIVGLLAAPGEAAAEDVQAALAGVGEDLATAEKRIGEIGANLTSRRGLIGQFEAIVRYEDALFRYLMGDFDGAAKEFFTLIESGALGDDVRHADSQWLFAECLFELGSYTLAEEGYSVILRSGDRHPHFASSVRRLLELYGITGDAKAFYNLYNAYIVSNKVSATDEVKYTLAKSFRRQGAALYVQANNLRWQGQVYGAEAMRDQAEQAFARAKSQLTQVGAGGNFYARSRYSIGVILLQQGELSAAYKRAEGQDASVAELRASAFSAAIDEFKVVAAVPQTSPEDIEVVDLANLAIARLCDELGRHDEALVTYALITNVSRYFPDALYERVWTAIKIEDYDSALASAEIFLLAFPEHRYTAQLKVIQGSLHMKEKQYKQALVSYERVVAEYTPLYDRVSKIADDNLSANDWFSRLAAAPDPAAYFNDELPLYAVEMLVSDPGMAKALRIYREAERQRADIAASETLIAEIEAALAAGAGGAAQQSEQELTSVSLSLQRAQGELLAAEESLLQEVGDSALREQVGAITSRREQLRAELTVARAGGELSANPALSAEYVKLRAELKGLRGGVSDPIAQGQLAEIDKHWATLGGLDKKVADLQGRLGGVQSGELATIQRRLDQEKAAVATSKVAVDATLIEAGALAGQVTQEGFRELEDQFSLSILKADRGIVDVYWVEKVRVTDELKAVKTDRSAMVANLEAQFNVIRQGLPPEPTPTAVEGTED